MGEKRFYRPDELALALEESRRKIYRWIREGRIRTVRHVGLLRIERAEFNRIIKGKFREPVCTNGNQ